MTLSNFPIGTILAWENEVIPSGWAVCDGNNGTPNLIDKFILGASVDDDIRDIGGSDSHSHANPNTNDRLAHNHGGSKSFQSGTGNDIETQAGTGAKAASGNHTHQIGVNIGSANLHSHTLGSKGSRSILPIYVYSVFIRRIS